MYEAIGCANRRARSGEDERSRHFPRDVSSERISRDVHTHLSTIINIYHSVVLLLLLHEQQPKKGQNFGLCRKWSGLKFIVYWEAWDSMVAEII